MHVLNDQTVTFCASQSIHQHLWQAKSLRKISKSQIDETFLVHWISSNWPLWMCHILLEPVRICQLCKQKQNCQWNEHSKSSKKSKLINQNESVLMLQFQKNVCSNVEQIFGHTNNSKKICLRFLTVQWIQLCQLNLVNFLGQTFKQKIFWSFFCWTSSPQHKKWAKNEALGETVHRWEPHFPIDVRRLFFSMVCFLAIFSSPLHIAVASNTFTKTHILNTWVVTAQRATSPIKNIFLLSLSQTVTFIHILYRSYSQSVWMWWRMMVFEISKWFASSFNIICTTMLNLYLIFLLPVILITTP